MPTPGPSEPTPAGKPPAPHPGRPHAVPPHPGRPAAVPPHPGRPAAHSEVSAGLDPWPGPPRLATPTVVLPPLGVQPRPPPLTVVPCLPVPGLLGPRGRLPGLAED